MKREFLQGLGLEADVIKQIMAVHGSEINELTGKVTALEDDKADLERQVAQKDKQLAKFDSGEVEDLQSQIEMLKQEHANEIEALKREHLLEVLASTAGVTDDAKEFVLFKLKDVEMTDGKLVGADEIISGLKETNPSLFTQEAKTTVAQDTKPKWSNGGVSTVNNGSLSVKDIMAIEDATERQKAIQDNMHLFSNQ
ncbi:phage scaffolding protein [Aerococcaceae bacterium NML160702]|nr:phage scaffolding protein [Aerococcaceae bacterium NML160702]